MTEAEWLACTDPVPMLEFVRGRVSDRKLRLFAVACCRTVWHRLDDRRSRKAVQVVERYADGKASAQELAVAWEVAADVNQVRLCRCNQARDYRWHYPQCIACNSAHPHADYAAVVAANCVSSVDDDAARRHRSCILRHIIGDPFHTSSVETVWPLLVSDLARQLYHSAEIRPILHDALLDAGHSALAEHFRAEEWHPKGCWVVDLVLGKS